MANYRRQSVAPDAAKTLAHQVYQTLRQEILGGVLPPGTRLVRRTISQRLAVSPVPVTEALLRLEIEGLVQNRPLYGCRVRPLVLEDVQNDAVLREAIECQAARLAAEQATDSRIGRLDRQARRLDQIVAAGDPRSAAGREAHQDFHLGVAAASGYPRLAEELQRVWFRRLMWMNWVKATYYKPVPVDWHQRLVASIAARDPDAAEATMREHVRYGREDDQKALEYILARQAGREDDQ